MNTNKSILSAIGWFIIGVAPMLIDIWGEEAITIGDIPSILIWGILGPIAWINFLRIRRNVVIVKAKRPR